MIDFSSGQLISKLQELEQNAFTGEVEVTATVPKQAQNKSKLIILRKGKLVFADSKFISPQELATKLGEKLDISIIKVAIETINQKMSDPNSFQEMFAFLAKMRIIQPEQVEAFILNKIILTLEQLSSCSGTFTTNSSIQFDLVYQNNVDGWSLAELIPQLTQRKQKWQKLTQVGITSINAVPKVVPEAIKTISSIVAKKHCQEWIDGKRNIGEIAEKIQQDPLKLATDYSNWVNQKWIYFGKQAPLVQSQKSPVAANKPEQSLNQPTILSVDDSPVVQTMLKRALKDNYQVLLANNGMDALKILNSKQTIDLVLLDVTMPDIDGNELCRTIRRFKKFQDLPIIMLTAKDGMFDKVKGKFAGSTEYLTKPVDKEELLTTINKYVPSLTPISQ